MVTGKTNSKDLSFRPFFLNVINTAFWWPPGGMVMQEQQKDRIGCTTVGFIFHASLGGWSAFHSTLYQNPKAHFNSKPALLIPSPSNVPEANTPNPSASMTAVIKSV